MNEYRPDHIGGGEDSDERPSRPVPDVENANERPALSGREAPLDIHPRGYTTDVPESDRRGGVVDLLSLIHI